MKSLRGRCDRRRLFLENAMSGFRLYNRHLDAFLACAQTGSFTQAAQILYVTPTALIKRINAFEEGLGAKLFVRTPQGVRLTAAGERLLRESDALISLSDSIRRDVLRADAAGADEIRVGASTVFPGRYVFDCFERHRRDLPNLRLRLISYGNTRLEVYRTLSRLGVEVDLIAGVFDERFLGRYDASGSVLEKVPIGLSVPSHDPLANRDKIPVWELNGRTVLIPQTGMLEDFDDAAETLLRLAPGAKTVEFELLDVETFNRAAATGAVILNIGCWTEAHPLFRHVPLDWEQRARFVHLRQKRPRGRLPLRRNGAGKRFAPRGFRRGENLGRGMIAPQFPEGATALLFQ